MLRHRQVRRIRIRNSIILDPVPKPYPDIYTLKLNLDPNPRLKKYRSILRMTLADKDYTLDDSPASSPINIFMDNCPTFVTIMLT